MAGWIVVVFFFFSGRRRHTRCLSDWSSDVCSSDLDAVEEAVQLARETPSLAVGLHLVLAQGRPAAPPAEIPGLVAADGAFRRAPIDTGIRYAWQYRSEERRVGKECRSRRTRDQNDK